MANEGARRNKRIYATGPNAKGGKKKKPPEKNVTKRKGSGTPKKIETVIVKGNSSKPNDKERKERGEKGKMQTRQEKKRGEGQTWDKVTRQK